MTRRSEMIVEGLTGLASRHEWHVHVAVDEMYASIVLYREDLAISVYYETPEGQFDVTCYWLPGPYAPTPLVRLTSSNLYSFGLHELMALRLGSDLKREKKRLWRRARPADEAKFKAQVAVVSELIEKVVPDILAGNHDVLKQFGRAGEKGRQLGYTSEARDKADQVWFRQLWRHEEWIMRGCAVVIGIAVVAIALTCQGP